MRDLKECQAEVFRRSENRIKLRRQRRRRILMACVPLALGITLFSALVLPVVVPVGLGVPGATEAAMGSIPENVDENHLCSFTKIEVSGPGVALSYTEASDIQLIADRLNAYTVAESENNGASAEETRGEDLDGTVDRSDIHYSIGESANTGYKITLVMGEDDSTDYYLVGNTLTNGTAGCTLSQAQVNELKDLLGIPRS